MIGLGFLNPDKNSDPNSPFDDHNPISSISDQIPTTDNVVEGVWNKIKELFQSFLPTKLYDDLFPTYTYGIESPESIKAKRTKQMVLIAGIVLLYKYCLPRKYQII